MTAYRDRMNAGEYEPAEEKPKRARKVEAEEPDKPAPPPDEEDE